METVKEILKVPGYLSYQAGSRGQTIMRRTSQAGSWSERELTELIAVGLLFVTAVILGAAYFL